MKKKLIRVLLFFAGLVLVFGLLFLRTFSSAPLPKSEAFSGSLPAASPPPEMAMFHLPTGMIHRSAAFAYRGGAFSDKRDFVMSAILIKHPKGDLLIDAGFGSDVDAHFAKMPLFFRLGTSYEKKIPAAIQLTKAGYDSKKLRGILLTHAHWDHASGLSDFSKIPVLVTADEQKFINSENVWADVARGIPGVNYEEYKLEEKPYLGFKQSFDFYGDGSIVIVAAPGHTPGSIIVFVTLPNSRRYALVGDLVWQREGITLREERAWLFRRSADSEPAQVRENILRMAALAAYFPELILVPAHDARGYEKIPQL